MRDNVANYTPKCCKEKQKVEISLNYFIIMSDYERLLPIKDHFLPAK
jgi:hypothetical protein